MAAEARLCALGIFKLNDLDPLNRFFPHPEKPGGHLGDHMIVIGLEFIGVAPLACAAEGS